MGGMEPERVLEVIVKRVHSLEVMVQAPTRHWSALEFIIELAMQPKTARERRQGVQHARDPLSKAQVCRTTVQDLYYQRSTPPPR